MLIRWQLITGTLTILAGEPGPHAADHVHERGSGVEMSRGCGGDAFSFAEVDGPRRGRGALHTVPDTLCADVEEFRRPAIGSLNVVIEPPGRRGREPMPVEPRSRAPF
jgi:hypothetical protein